MPVRLTPTQYADKQATRLKAATDDIRQGVQNVSVSPTLKAAAAKAKMLAGITQAITSGRWENGLKRVTLEDWKSKTLEKGIGRIAAGIDAAHATQIVFAEKLFAYENTLLARIEAMPNVTLEDSISRMNEWVRQMAKFVY